MQEKQDVQAGIDDDRYGQKQQRGPGIPHRTQHGRAEIVPVGSQKTAENDPQIYAYLSGYFTGGLDKPQNPRLELLQ